MVPFLLEVNDLTVRFGHRLAVAGVSMIARGGQITAIVGPNGAGKTTTMEVCTGLRQPSSGTVHLLGGAPNDPKARAQIGVMLQSGGLYPTARPLEWLIYLSRLCINPGDPAALLRQVGIDPSTRTTTRRLSGGEQQRVKLAAALLPQPALLFLDEPTAGLDPAARQDLLALLKKRRLEGVSIIMTTHQLDDVEELADEVIVMAAGRVLEQGSVANLTDHGQALQFQATAGLDLASLQAHLSVGYAVQEPAPGHYLITGATTPALLADITAWCAANAVLASDIRPGSRTLEQIVIEASRGNS